MWAIALLVLTQAANPWLDEARVRERALDYAHAIEQLEIARKVPSLDEAQRREVLLLLARCLIAEGRRSDAAQVFTELLRAEPTFEFARRDGVSPKVLEVFDAAKRALFPTGWVGVEESVAPGGLYTIRLLDPWRRVKRVERVERVDERPEQRVEIERAPVISFKAQTTAGHSLEWHVEWLGEAGEVVARTETHRIAIPTLTLDAPPQVLPRAPRTQLWVGVGLLAAAVVGASVGAGLQANGWSLRQAARDGSKPPGDWADTARAAEATGLTQTRWALGLFIGSGVVTLTGIGVIAF